MEVRRATMDDIEQIAELGLRLHMKSANARFQFSGMRARVLVASCIVRRNMCAMVALEGKLVVGFILGHVDEHPFIEIKYATDLATCSAQPGAGRQLIEAFTKWAFDEAQADQVILGVTYGGKDHAAIYERLGFENVGGMFTRSKA